MFGILRFTIYDLRVGGKSLNCLREHSVGGFLVVVPGVNTLGQAGAMPN
jgi:hypothetical protein